VASHRAHRVVCMVINAYLLPLAFSAVVVGSKPSCSRRFAIKSRSLAQSGHFDGGKFVATQRLTTVKSWLSMDCRLNHCILHISSVVCDCETLYINVPLEWRRAVAVNGRSHWNIFVFFYCHVWSKKQIAKSNKVCALAHSSKSLPSIVPFHFLNLHLIEIEI